MKIINPFKYTGEIKVNASKSNVQRLLAIALLSDSKTTLNGYQSCSDNDACLTIIKQLGAKVIAGKSLSIYPPQKEKQKDISLFVNESGLSLRMFAFIASLFGNKIKLSASGTLLKRPLDFLQQSLENSGLTVTNAVFPFEYYGELRGGNIHIDGSESSQMLTGLLISSPLLSIDTTITVSHLASKPYIDLTLQLMKEFGVSVENNNYHTFEIKGNQRYSGKDIVIEGDWSGAANHVVGAAISGKVKLLGLSPDSLQADRICLEIVSQFGAKITWLNGDLIVEKAKKPTPIVVDLTNNPDLFPILSILACGAIGTSVFTSTDRLIHKESNRLETVQEMLTALGVSFTVGKNAIEIHGKGFVDGGVINSFNDHRIAMAAAISACISTSKIQLTNPTCIEKSYPMFFNDLGL